MARYEVTYDCGCTGTVNLFGKHADRERKLEWLAGQDCYACSSKKALEKAQADTTPVTMILEPYTTSAGMDIVAVMQGGTYRVRDELKRLGAVWGVPPTSIDYATYGGNGLGTKCWYIRAPLNPKKVCELCESIDDRRVTAENVWRKLVDMAGILAKYPVDVKGSQRYIERMAGALGELRDRYLADKKDEDRREAWLKENPRPVLTPLREFIGTDGYWNGKVYGGGVVYVDSKRYQLKPEQVKQIEQERAALLEWEGKAHEETLRVTEVKL